MHFNSKSISCMTCKSHLLLLLLFELILQKHFSNEKRFSKKDQVFKEVCFITFLNSHKICTFSYQGSEIHCFCVIANSSGCTSWAMNSEFCRITIGIYFTNAQSSILTPKSSCSLLPLQRTMVQKLSKCEHKAALAARCVQFACHSDFM